MLIVGNKNKGAFMDIEFLEPLWAIETDLTLEEQEAEDERLIQAAIEWAESNDDERRGR